jgi:hypothetical protein
MTACGFQRKPKIHDHRNYKNHTAIGGRSALDLRAEVVCAEKGFLLGPIVRFKPISNSQITNCVARHASGATDALRVLRAFKFSLCAVPVATLCVFVAILVPCV